jgi:hypothetical protein
MDVVQIFIDFQQACDSIDGAVTGHIMREFRILKKLVRIVELTIKHILACVKI